MVTCFCKPVARSRADTFSMPSRFRSSCTTIWLPAGTWASPCDEEVADAVVVADVLVFALVDLDLDLRLLVVDRVRTPRCATAGSGVLRWMIGAKRNGKLEAAARSSRHLMPSECGVMSTSTAPTSTPAMMAA